jgi:hypothetical protein
MVRAWALRFYLDCVGHTLEDSNLCPPSFSHSVWFAESAQSIFLQTPELA